jgi:hypothetical protein
VVPPGHQLHLLIDSLCINQEDNEEKSHQVWFMDQVYAHAFKVFICLGESDSDSNEAMDVIYPL